MYVGDRCLCKLGKKDSVLSYLTYINYHHQPAPTGISQSKAKRVQEYVVAGRCLLMLGSLGRKERFKVPLSLPKLPTSTYTNQQPLTLFNKKHL